MRHGDIIGGSYDREHTLTLRLDFGSERVFTLPRRYNMEQAAALHRNNPPRPGGPPPLPRDTYQLRTDCAGRDFWIHESLLTGR